MLSFASRAALHRVVAPLGEQSMLGNFPRLLRHLLGRGFHRGILLALFLLLLRLSHHRRSCDARVLCFVFSLLREERAYDSRLARMLRSCLSASAFSLSMQQAHSNMHSSRISHPQKRFLVIQINRLLPQLTIPALYMNQRLTVAFSQKLNKINELQSRSAACIKKTVINQ